MLSKNGFKPGVHLYLQHGWGFNRDCFQTWANYAKLWRLTFLDRGYFGQPVSFAKPSAEELTVLVCHSLGVHYFSIDQLKSIDLLVVLSGFANFHGDTMKDGILSRKHIKRMKKRLRQEPEGLIRDFYRDCSWSGPLPDFRAVNLDLLSEDLILLDTVSIKHKHIQRMESVIIHGSSDRIVPVERARELSSCLDSNTVHIIARAGHGLPFTHPGVCLSYINNQISRL